MPNPKWSNKPTFIFNTAIWGIWCAYFYLFSQRAKGNKTACGQPFLNIFIEKAKVGRKKNDLCLKMNIE
jgi:hypothetical protein